MTAPLLFYIKVAKTIIFLYNIPIMTTKKHLRNFYLPYIKGCAILGIILIHLIDWSNLKLSANWLLAKELLYPSVLFFIATAGSVVYIAYNHYPPLKYTYRLVRRGLELIGIYFLVNIVKLFIFNFDSEPFYLQFKWANTLNLNGLWQLKSFTSPITILLTIGAFLIFSPLLLWIIQNVRWPKTTVLILIAALFVGNYYLVYPASPLVNFLLAKNNITFPLILWLLPFLIGLFLAMDGFENHKLRYLLIFGALTGATWLSQGHIIKPYSAMYPLQPSYIFFSFFFMYCLIFFFTWLEKIRIPVMKLLLGIIRFLGDHTLSIYVYHWLVIDLSIWLLFPAYKWIWLTVFVFLLAYLVAYRHKIADYWRGTY